MTETDVLNYQGPIAVTVAYFCLWYYLLLGLQRGTKYKLVAEYAARGEEFDRYFGQDPRMLAADRAVINTQEQMVPFLTALWLHAVFVGASSAAYLGLGYVVLRSIYPLLLGKNLSKTQSKRVFFVTGPAYVIVFSLLGSTMYMALLN